MFTKILSIAIVGLSDKTFEEAPFPCGYLGDKSHKYIDNPLEINQDKKSISGPLLEHRDIHLVISAIKLEKFTEQETNHVENSQLVRALMQKVQDKQSNRYIGTTITFKFTNNVIKISCALSQAYVTLLRQAVIKMDLSGISHYQIPWTIEALPY